MSYIRLTLHALCWFLPFFQCSALSFDTSFIHTITPEILTHYASKVPDHKAQKWIDAHTSFLAYLARMPFPLSSWPDKYSEGNWHLYKLGIKNYGYSNFIFQIPETDYWIQIAGPKHRVRNLYTYNTGNNSYWYREILKHWELRNSTLIDAFEIIPTYQTISRFAYYLILQEALETLECTHIRITPTYLVHLRGHSKEMGDEQYIVVQKHIQGLIQLREHSEHIQNIEEQAFIELFQIICATGYWNIKNGLHGDEQHNLVLLDYEQRNIENPADFFFKDLRSFEQCVYNGIEELLHIYVKPYAPETYQRLLWHIAINPSLSHSSLWPKYLALLSE